MSDVDDAVETPAVGRLQRLEVQNFKSYKGLHSIGPFSNFTAVIGPNGSGKSNLMDAISFVCGVDTSHLRGKLKEFLYCNQRSDDPSDHPDTGHVSLVFEHVDSSVVHFTRAIVTSGRDDAATHSSRYTVAGQTVTAETFTQRLLDIGINAKAKNFLVFQGDIEKVAQKTPQELTKFFELVSGSEGLRAEYEQLEDKVLTCQEASGGYVGKRKALEKRRKVLAEAKDEAERYRAQTAVLLDYREAAAGAAQHEAAAAELQRSHQADVDKAGGSVAEVAALKKEKNTCVRALDELRRKRDEQNPQRLQAREVLVRQNRELERTKKNVAAIKEKAATTTHEIEETVTDIAKLEKALAKAESGASKAAGIELTDEQQDEYRDLKLRADEETVGDLAALAQARSTIQALEPSANALEEQLADIHAQQASLDADIAEREAKESDCKAAEAEQMAAVKKLRAELDASLNGKRKQQTQRRTLSERINALEQKVAAAAAQEHSTQKERRMAEAVAEMKRRHPREVLGRLADICKPNSSKYNVAIAVLMGRQMDSVVVRTFEVGRACVALLKELRTEPMEFIPLDNISAPAINERLRALGNVAQLGVDLVQYPKEVEKAVLYAMGNALVASTPAGAKKLNREGGHKVTDLDGTLIAVNGSMSGGATRSFQDRARQFDVAAAQRDREELQRKRQEFDAIPDEHVAKVHEDRMQRDINSAQMELNSRAVATESATRQLSKRRQERATVADAAAAAEPRLAELQTKLDEPRDKVAMLEARVNKVRDRVFKAFSKSVGVKNMREHEAKLEAALQEAQDRQGKLRRQIVELRGAEDLKRSHLAELDIKRSRYDDAVEAAKKSIAEAEARQTSVAGSAAAFDEQLAEKQAALDDVKSRLAALDEATRAAKSGRKKLSAEVQAHLREKELHERCMAACLDNAKDVHRDAMLTMVDLTAPAATGGRKRSRGDNNAGASTSGRRSRRRAAAGGDDDNDASDCDGLEDDADIDGGKDEIDEAAGGSGGEVPAELRGAFSSLPRELQRTTDDAARKKKRKELAAEIEAVAEQLEDTAPNLKAPEQYAEVLAEAQALQEEITAANKAAAEAQREFSDVKEARAARFNEAFEHVAACIGRVYSDLTRAAGKPGSDGANLYRVNPDEPYTDGVRFSVIPPGKRYMSMRDLSGGEKTIAALALLLAVHSYKPSPFFVFDEVDAALDATNLLRVARYVRANTRDDHQHRVQGIVISLKDTFYQVADALVGVTKNAASTGSAVYTCDLARFGEPQE